MYCKNCNSLISHDSKYCNYCGADLTKNTTSNNNNQNINNNVNNVKLVENNNNNSQKFLILGIISAMLCSMPVGAAIILLNELKYKKQLASGNHNGAKNTKILMIVLFIFGILLSIGLGVLQIFLTNYND